ncbi:hypothetical protein [Martelella soudanensis]|uniref:hypothetical protein n=1 Tax=Martelella sp. NC20 TaxID=2740298 RepID=UPI0015DF814C|nr:hypothetical protein [Martelella sp. NC20]
MKKGQAMAGTDWRKSFDLKHPSLKPLWVRILAVVLCAGWAVAELFIGSPFWAIPFGAAAAYMAYIFFLSPDRHYFSTKDTPGE